MSIINPFIAIVEKFDFKKRFIALMGLSLLVIVPVCFLYIKSELKELNFSQNERETFELYKPINSVRSAVYQLRSSVLNALITGKSVRLDASNIDNLMNNFEKSNYVLYQASDSFKKLLRDQDSLIQKLNTVFSKDDLKEQESVLNDISEGGRGLIGDLANESQLTLDPDLTMYQLVSMFVGELPTFFDKFADMYDDVVRAYVNKTPTDEMRMDYFESLGYIQNAMANFRLEIDMISVNNPELSKKYDQFYQKINTELQLFINQVNAVMLSTAPLSTGENKFGPHFDRMIEISENISEEALSDFGKLLNERITSIKMSIGIVLGALLFVFFIYSMIFVAFYKLTVSLIEMLIKNTHEIANGDLTSEIKLYTNDEFSKLVTALNLMRGKLTDVVKKIQGASNAVARGAEEISQGNLDLSSRTEKQASSLATTAANMEELSITVRDNAEQAKKAAELSDQTRKQADASGVVVNNAVSAMNEINSSSKKIAEISSVIDEIAFQTNLLALNAAVEAARAGEQGRGFAVVAGEVRNLAQRTSTAAKEISVLIRDSVDRVSQGTDLVNKSGDALAEIMQSVAKISDLIKNIATATNEQSNGLEGINKAVTQMDAITQQNAALVEETAAASEGVDKQAKELINLIGFFKCDNSLDVDMKSPSRGKQEKSSVKKNSSSNDDEKSAEKKSSEIKKYVPKEKRASVEEDSWKEF